MMLVGTALVCAAGAMLFAGMIGVWFNLREAAGGTTAGWLPEGAVVPEVATNVMLFGMIAISFMAQWAVYAMKDANRKDSAIALGVTVLLGLAMVNAQAYVYGQMGLGISGGVYQSLFYALTGTWLAALLGGIAFTGIVAFRSLGGRYTPKRHEGVAALAMYWHFLTVAFVAVWFTVYVWK